MKKFLFVLFTASLLVLGCSNYEVNIQPKQTEAKDIPFDFYVHEDEDGCKYLIVYEEQIFRNGNSGGMGVGLGITPKVNQSAECIQNK